MRLNLNDPASIVAWWLTHPVRHSSQLMAFARLHAQFQLPIRAAIRTIKSDPARRQRFEEGLALAAVGGAQTEYNRATDSEGPMQWAA